MISVILPTYEQVDAVLCALAALESQTLPTTEFELIVVDDSKTSVVEDVLFEAALFEAGFQTHFYNYFLRYLRSSPPRVGSFTAGRARNIGAANARGDLLVFIDQDVMLAPDALQHYARAYAYHGDNTVIVGLYHWLPAMAFSPEDVKERFLEILSNGMSYLTSGNTVFPTIGKLPMDEPGIQGRDMREDDFGDIDHVVDDAALGAFSGNIGYPRRLFMTLGGFDENIRGHGGEDADLGLTAKERGAKFLLYKDIWGLHRWHPRNQAKNAAEVQENIQYIDRKHGIGKYGGAHKWMDAQDWRDPRHYHKDVGGVLMQATGESTIWVCRDGHRLGLPSPDWIERLGFIPGQVVATTPAGLNAYADEGVAGG